MVHKRYRSGTAVRNHIPWDSHWDITGRLSLEECAHYLPMTEWVIGLILNLDCSIRSDGSNIRTRFGLTSHALRVLATWGSFGICTTAFGRQAELLSTCRCNTGPI